MGDFIAFVFCDFSKINKEVLIGVFFVVYFGHVDDVEVVVVFVELTAAEEHLGDFLYGYVGVMCGAFFLEGCAADKEAFALLHCLADSIEAFHRQKLRRGVYIVVFRTLSLLPVEGCVGLVGVSLLLGHCCGKHIGIVFFVDDEVAKPVFLQQTWCQLVEFEPAAAFPVLSLADAALVTIFNRG